MVFWGLIEFNKTEKISTKTANRTTDDCIAGKFRQD